MFASILGSFCTLLTIIIVPLCLRYKKIQKQIREDVSNVRKIPELVNSINEHLNCLDESLEEIKHDQSDLLTRQEDQEKKIDGLETMQLKHMINDAFKTYKLEEMPYEDLVAASQYCDIYTGKGLNHETGARCRKIYAELERRAAQEGGNRNGQ